MPQCMKGACDTPPFLGMNDAVGGVKRLARNQDTSAQLFQPLGPLGLLHHDEVGGQVSQGPRGLGTSGLKDVQVILTLVLCFPIRLSRRQ